MLTSVTTAAVEAIQQKHLRGAGKPIDSAALTHSYGCRQYHKEKLEELGKHLPIENLESHSAALFRKSRARCRTRELWSKDRGIPKIPTARTTTKNARRR